MSTKDYFRAAILPVAFLSASILNIAHADETASSWDAALADIKPIFETRLRYEAVDQDGLAEASRERCRIHHKTTDSSEIKNTKTHRYQPVHEAIFTVLHLIVSSTPDALSLRCYYSAAS